MTCPKHDDAQKHGDTQKHSDIQKHSVDTAVWNKFVSRHASGGVIDGVVVSVVPFGAFVDVGDGVHGLLHESSSAARPEPGSRVSVRIQALDVERRRMSLILA